ncbi:MAG: vitamin K epoxide reductase family protein, partial [Prolixibacteraceae bacterium]
MVERGITRLTKNNENHPKQKNKMPDVDDMSREERRKKLYSHHKQILWIYWLIILLGVWMIFSPHTFSYGKSVVSPGGDRSLWLSTEARIAAMTWSDIISGILLIVFGWRSLRPDRPVSNWIICLTGIWMTTAPVFFWAPTAAAYLNSVITGALAIALSVIIPGIPNLVMFVHKGPEVPPGWSYNPSSWPQRGILIFLAFAGWMISRYLGAYQLGFTDKIWEPFFGDGSKMILSSDISHGLPVSDGALGAYAYTFEFLMVWVGAPNRWRTMPWIVTIFGILVIPLGMVHLFLVISQPVLIGHWCTLCLLAAVIMLPMIPLEADEVIANIQHLKEAVSKGENFWYVFFTGGGPTEVNTDERSPQIADLPSEPVNV